MCAVLAFTPVESAVGGALIGLSAATYLLCYGRVLGFSGILNQGTATPLTHGQLPALWRVLLLAGLVGGGLLSSKFTSFPLPMLDYPLSTYAWAGLVMGFGAASGQGCTSGHGICGLGRLSPRSLVAVLTFMSAAAAATYFAMHVADSCAAPGIAPLKMPADLNAVLLPAGSVVGAMVATCLLVKMLDARGLGLLSDAAHALLALSVGLTSGVGLVLAGMLDQNKVRGFLDVAGVWDPSLAFVMGSGAAISLGAHTMAKSMAKPYLSSAFAYPPSCEFGTKGSGSLKDPKLLLGSVAFGLSWGSLGICPGPSIVGLAGPFAGVDNPLRFPAFVLGTIVGFVLEDRMVYKSEGPPAPKPVAAAALN